MDILKQQKKKDKKLCLIFKHSACFMRVDMCNLGEILELEAIKSERVRNIKSIMTKLKMSFKEAIAFLEIPKFHLNYTYPLS